MKTKHFLNLFFCGWNLFNVELVYSRMDHIGFVRRSWNFGVSHFIPASLQDSRRLASYSCVAPSFPASRTLFLRRSKFPCVSHFIPASLQDSLRPTKSPNSPKSHSNFPYITILSKLLRTDGVSRSLSVSSNVFLSS
jgi:hypothetical protein